MMTRLSSAGLLCAVIVLAMGCTSATTGVKGGNLVPFGPAGTTETETGKRYALVIGINDFDDSKFGDLQFAQQDAVAIADSLKTFDEVVLLTAGDDTRKGQIERALSRLDKKATGARDTLLVYVSSHGTLARRPGGKLERYLVTRDTELSRVPDTGINLEQLIKKIDRMSPQRKAIILAMCHSGTGKSRVDDDLSEALASRKGPSIVPAFEDVSEAMIVVSAAAANEAAREDEKLGHDIYTYFLLEALEAADRDADGAVTVSEAHDYARERTYLYTSGSQRPTAKTSVMGNDPVVLAGKRKRLGKSVLFSYDPSAEGVRIVIDGAEKGVLPGGIAVAEGEHSLRLEDSLSGETLFEEAFQVGLGQRIDLSNLVRRAHKSAAYLTVGMASPLQSEIEGSYMPATPTAALQLTHRFADDSGPSATVQVSYGQGNGGPDDAQFDFSSVEGVALAGWAFLVTPEFSLTPSVGGGALWANRSMEGGSDQWLTGWTGRCRLAAGWAATHSLSLIALSEGGVMRARLGRDQTHLVADFQVGVGWSF